jgi:hypothetical protein
MEFVALKVDGVSKLDEKSSGLEFYSYGNTGLRPYSFLYKIVDKHKLMLYCLVRPIDFRVKTHSKKDVDSIK